MAEIAIPRLSSNDDSFTLRKWCVPTATRVEAETIVAVVEDSKTAVEVSAGTAGFLHHRAEVGEEYGIGHVIALVTDSNAAPRATETSAAPAAGTRVVITHGAREAMTELGIVEADAMALGKPVVRRSDIEALKSAPQATPAGTPLPKHQIAVSRVVTSSHRSIPKAFLLMKVRCDQMLKRLEGRSYGLTEVLVRAIADLAEKFPDCYARLEDDSILRPEEGVNVGVTFDLGKGLFIPVVHGAGEKTPSAIGDELKGFRERAMAGRFQEPEVAGGHITLALNPGEGVVFSLPMIFPGQTAILSLGNVEREVVPLDDGGFGVAQLVHLGVAYDHRVVNGTYALDYMTALKRRLEYPGSSRWL